jgi:hypothetical protein
MRSSVKEMTRQGTVIERSTSRRSETRSIPACPLAEALRRAAISKTSSHTAADASSFSVAGENICRTETGAS